jgi:Protein of unknown function (DUF3829)
MNAYVRLLNDTLYVKDSLETYARTVDPKKGPTKARHVELTAPGPRIDGTLAAAEKAAGEVPAFGVTDQAASAFVQAYRAASPVIVKYAAYYSRKDQLADDFKGAVALHGELLPHLAPLITARRNFDAAVEVTKTETDQRELTDVEAREGKSFRWHRTNVMIHARKTIVHMPSRDNMQIDMARFSSALTAFAAAVRAFDEYTATNPKDVDASASAFRSQPAGVLGKVREVHDILAKVKGDARRLDAFAGPKIMIAVTNYNVMTSMSR